jgi:hypothetical protein
MVFFSVSGIPSVGKTCYFSTACALLQQLTCFRKWLASTPEPGSILDKMQIIMGQEAPTFVSILDIC